MRLVLDVDLGVVAVVHRDCGRQDGRDLGLDLLGAVALEHRRVVEEVRVGSEESTEGVPLLRVDEAPVLRLEPADVFDGEQSRHRVERTCPIRDGV